MYGPPPVRSPPQRRARESEAAGVSKTSAAATSAPYAPAASSNHTEACFVNSTSPPRHPPRSATYLTKRLFDVLAEQHHQRPDADAHAEQARARTGRQTRNGRYNRPNDGKATGLANAHQDATQKRKQRG